MKLRALVVALGLALGTAVHAAPPVLVEMVDLSCAHCAAFAGTAGTIAERVRRAGGIFRIAPVGPVIGKDSPALAVLAVYWSESHQDDASGEAIVAAFYAGYQNNADLAGPAGIASWLATRGITWPASADLQDPRLHRRFFRAVRMAGNAGVSDLPAVLFINPDSGAVTHVEAWYGSAADLGNRINNYLQQEH